MTAMPYAGPERRQRRQQSFLDRLQASNVPGRIFLFFLSAQTAWLAYIPSTMTSRIFREADGFCWLIIIVAAVGMLDTFVNDILPDRFRFTTALSIRHLTLMICSGFFASGAFLASKMCEAWSVIPYFVACSLVIAMHAFFDVRRRLKRSV